MQSRWWSLLVVLGLVFAPRVAVGQCGMMGGGGHDHGRETAPKPERSEKKVRQAVRQALAEERGRQALMEEILADPAFMRALIAQIAEAPEWRAAVEKSMAGTASPAPSGELAPAPRSAAAMDTLRAPGPPPAAPEAQALFTCPMHPEVTSRSSGKCPKCGMTLRRV